MASNTGHYELAESIEPDSWDAWNSDRDQALTAEASSQTGAADSISPDESQNPAWNDLDANGNWYNVPGQGYVWSPYDASNAGWDPYGYGSWMFTPGYGYIWDSGYSWGYLPYQCGAWNFYDGFGWGWAPGLGGCQPWWGCGYYGGPNIGHGPGGYRPIPRPMPPHGPIGHRPIPVVAVNRHMAFAEHGFSGARQEHARDDCRKHQCRRCIRCLRGPVYSHESFSLRRQSHAAGNTGTGTRRRAPATPARVMHRHALRVKRVTAPGYTPPPRPAPVIHSSLPHIRRRLGLRR